MKRTCFFCINGIRTDPSNQRAWTDEMTSALNLRTPDGVKAEKFEYACSATFRRLKQPERAEDLVYRVNQYANDGWRVVLIGHSNGCDLIARLFGMGVKVDAVHLFAPATDEEFFAVALGQRLVRRIHIYGSPDDVELKAASLTRRVLRFVGLGYGSMGLRGPAFAKTFPAEVQDHSIPGYGHSTWFRAGSYFNATVDLLLNNDAADVTLLSP